VSVYFISNYNNVGGTGAVHCAKIGYRKRQNV
jgi:hypothetical protein